jgi:glucose/arabinose dehydrogenase
VRFLLFGRDAGLAPELARVARPRQLGEEGYVLDVTPRRALVPAGWTISVWARVPKARLAAWTPDGALLVSVPSSGEVLRLTPKAGGGADTSVLLEGLDQPHGLAFGGETLYVAESDQVDAYTYADGRATRQRVVAAGLPDAKSADLGGAYAHALKSVAVGPDGSVYFSIGSTGNISAEDRDATPPRATIMRVAPAAQATVFATGVRNGTGLAIAPDGSVYYAGYTSRNYSIFRVPAGTAVET